MCDNLFLWTLLTETTSDFQNITSSISKVIEHVFDFRSEAQSKQNPTCVDVSACKSDFFLFAEERDSRTVMIKKVPPIAKEAELKALSCDICHIRYPTSRKKNGKGRG